MCRYRGTPHYLYARVRRYTGDTRGHKLARVCLLVNAACKHIHTLIMPQSKVPYDRVTSSSLPRMWHTLTCMAFTPRGITSYRGILPDKYIACRKFGCAFPSLPPDLINLLRNFRSLFIDVSGCCLYSGRSLALPFGLTIYRFVPLPSPRIHARWIKERRNDRHKYDLYLAESRRMFTSEYPGDFHRDSSSRQRIEFDFKNLMAVCLNQTIEVKTVSFYSCRSWEFNLRRRYKQFISRYNQF